MQRELPELGFEIKEVSNHANPRRDFSNIVLRRKAVDQPFQPQSGASRDDDEQRLPAHQLQARSHYRPPWAGHPQPGRELAKVNPPIRPREDVEFLWLALPAGELDRVVSDHACRRHEVKLPKHYFGNIWMAKSGYGGTEYLLPSLISEGTRRGMGYSHMARVTRGNPAQRDGLNHRPTYPAPAAAP